MSDTDREDFRAYAEAKRHFLVFYRARRPPVDAKNTAFMQTGEPLDVRHAGERLEVRTWGAGPALLLMHGVFASGGAFREMIPRLVTAGFRVIAFDAPAHGASQGAFAYSDEVADSILSVRDAAGPLAGALGHSFGTVWLLNAQRVGLNVPRLVCMNAVTTQHAALAIYARQNNLVPKVMEHLARMLEAFSPHEPQSVLNIARSLSVPGLVVHDRDDTFAKFEGAEQLAQTWRGSRSLWTEKLGHMDTLSDLQVASAVSAFFREGEGLAQ